MTEPRVLARFTEYRDLLDGIRAWVRENRLAHNTIDEVAGYAERYTQKLIGSQPVKDIGFSSLAPLLGAIGLKLWLVVDDEQLGRLQNRRHFKPSQWHEKRAANDKVPTTKTRSNKARKQFTGNTKYMSMLRLRALTMMTAKERSQSASKAARAKGKKLRKRVTT